MEGWNPEKYGKPILRAQKQNTRGGHSAATGNKTTACDDSGSAAVEQQGFWDGASSGLVGLKIPPRQKSNLEGSQSHCTMKPPLNVNSSVASSSSPAWSPALARWQARKDKRQGKSDNVAHNSSPSLDPYCLPQTSSNFVTDENRITSQNLPATRESYSSRLRQLDVNSSPTHCSTRKVEYQDSVEHRLKDAQSKALRSITAQERKHDKSNTVSLPDLDLARKPVDPLHPRKSRRSWAQQTDFDAEKATRKRESRLSSTSLKHVGQGLQQVSHHPSTPNELMNEASSTFWQNQSTTHIHGPRRRRSGLKRSRWATKQELKVEVHPIATGSNAWGSEAPSDATKESHQPDKTFGKLLQNEEVVQSENPLADWEGKMVPPHPDWQDRPRYNNNNAQHKDSFTIWLGNISGFTDDGILFVKSIPYVSIAAEKLSDADLCPDGIGYVTKLQTVNIQNAAHYGYTHDAEDATKYAKALNPQDFDDWGKLDPLSPGNVRFKDETTDGLVSNWLKHLENEKNSQSLRGTKRPSDVAEFEHTNRPSVDEKVLRPRLNIYLRPAVKADVPELTKIYNWHVEHGPRTSEVYKISEDDMQLRLDSNKSSKLPFLVAAKKSTKHNVAVDLEAEAEGFRSSHNSRYVQNVRRKHRAITRIEQLVGWASAEDLTAADYSEFISAEIELYVDSQYQNMGVGRCLMDKILEVCDPGYTALGGYGFHCSQKLRHRYNAGGARNLHKMFIILRKWKFSNTPSSLGESKKTSGIRDDEKWQIPWLQSFGFQVEGTLTGIGAKNGRYIDAAYLGRETQWQPNEGQLPNPLPRMDNNTADDQSDDDKEGQQ